MSQDNRINKQIALNIICAIISTALFVVSIVDFDLFWLKLVISAILAVLLIALVFTKTITNSKGEKQK